MICGQGWKRGSLHLPSLNNTIWPCFKAWRCTETSFLWRNALASTPSELLCPTPVSLLARISYRELLYMFCYMLHTACCVAVHIAAALFIARPYFDAVLITSSRHVCLQISPIGCSWKCLGSMQGTNLCLSEWLISVCFILISWYTCYQKFHWFSTCLVLSTNLYTLTWTGSFFSTLTFIIVWEYILVSKMYWGTA